MRKKEQSNLTAPSPRRFTLPKSHTLRGRQKFQQLFSSSKFINTPTITLRFALNASTDEDFQIGFISPKKIGVAAKRNRSKRLMREAFRLNRQILSHHISKFDGTLHAVFIARHSQLDYQSVENDMVTLLEDLRSQIPIKNSDEL